MWSFFFFFHFISQHIPLTLSCFSVGFENLREEKSSVRSKYLCTAKNPVAICSREPHNGDETP